MGNVMTKTELLKGSTISDYNPEFKCGIDDCSGDVVVIDRCKYFCAEHWKREMGFKKIKE